MKEIDRVYCKEAKLTYVFVDKYVGYPVHQFFLLRKCEICKMESQHFDFSKDEQGIPNYYVGHPYYPEKAEVFYCGAGCATRAREQSISDS